MSYLSFKYLENLLTYLRGCEERETLLGREGDRSLYTTVYLASGREAPVYQIPLPRDDLGVDVTRYGGELAPVGTVTGYKESVNDLLRRLPLRERTSPYRQILSLVIAAPVVAGRREAAEARLFEAWKEVPRNPDAKSTFYTATLPDGSIKWVAVQMEGVDPRFDPDLWRQKFKEPELMLLVPPESVVELRFLYVQWGFDYPKPRDFYLLFDEQAEQAPLLLVTAGQALTRASVTGANAQEVWYQSLWHRITDRTGSSADEIWSILPDLAPQVVDMTGDPLAVQAQTPLAIGENEQAVGTVSMLDQRISRTESELEFLYTRRSRIRSMLVQRDYYPVYLFRREEDCGLPPKLIRFLGRSLQELASFQYLHGNIAGVETHCLIGTMPVSMSAALAVPATETYLQDKRWAGWNLPLFVRADCSLSLDLEEEAMAEKVRALLANAGVPEGADVVLAGPETTGSSELSRLILTVLPEGQPLDQCLDYINGESVEPEAIRVEAGERLSVPLEKLRAEVPDAIRRGVDDLHGVAVSLVNKAETDWEALRERVQGLAADAMASDAAIEVTANAYKSLPEQWREFLERVIRLDDQLSSMNVTAWNDFLHAETARTGKLEAIATSYQEATVRIKDVERLLQAELNKLAEKAAEIKRATDQIAALKASLRNEQEKLDRAREALRRQLEEAAAQEAALKDQLVKLAEDRRALEEAKGRIDADRARLAQETLALASSRRALDEDRTRLETDRDALERELQALAEQREMLREAQVRAAVAAGERKQREIDIFNDQLQKAQQALERIRASTTGPKMPPPRPGSPREAPPPPPPAGGFWASIRKKFSGR